MISGEGFIIRIKCGLYYSLLTHLFCTLTLGSRYQLIVYYRLKKTILDQKAGKIVKFANLDSLNDRESSDLCQHPISITTLPDKPDLSQRCSKSSNKVSHKFSFPAIKPRHPSKIPQISKKEESITPHKF